MHELCAVKFRKHAACDVLATHVHLIYWAHNRDIWIHITWACARRWIIASKNRSLFHHRLYTRIRLSLKWMSTQTIWSHCIKLTKIASFSRKDDNYFSLNSKRGKSIFRIFPGIVSAWPIIFNESTLYWNKNRKRTFLLFEWNINSFLNNIFLLLVTFIITFLRYIVYKIENNC